MIENEFETVPPTGPASVSKRAAQAAHQAIDQISARSAQAEQRLRETGSKVSTHSQQLGNDISEYVTKNPLTAIGMAAAAGFVIGALLRR